MKLTEMIRKKGFIKTVEMDPPKGPNLQGLVEKVRKLKSSFDAINITDGATKHFYMSSIYAAFRLKELTGIEPIFHLTCRDHNKRSAQGILFAAASAGLENVLAITGDKSGEEETKCSRDVFDICSAIDLIKTIRSMNNGLYLNGETGEKTNFCIGAAGNPNADDLESEMGKLKAKVDSGAEFIQTQPVYDAERFFEYTEAASKKGITAPIIAGILPIKSYNNALFLEKIPGIRIPAVLKQRIAEKGSGEGLVIARELFHKLKSKAKGVHIFPIGNENLALSVIR